MSRKLSLMSGSINAQGARDSVQENHSHYATTNPHASNLTFLED